MAKIIIPTPLRKFTDRNSSFDTNAENIKDALTKLTEAYPDLKKHIFDDKDQLRSFIKIYVGDDEIGSLENEKTAVSDDTVVSIVPAIAGGNFDTLTK